MASHEARGTKRKCQNEECALPFYDLNRVDCACPNCGAAFVASAIIGRGAAAARAGSQRAAFAAPPPLLDPVEPAQSEELEVSADSSEVADDETADDGDQVADLILEQDDTDDEGIVVGPMPEGRPED